MPRKNPVTTSKETGLDDRQDRFCREYLIDFNATRAAKVAGYAEKSAASQASELLKKPYIQARIKFLAEQYMTEAGDPIKRILCELQMIAFSDMRDFMSWDSYSIKWKNSDDLGDKTRIIEEVSETVTQHGGSKKLKLYSKEKALEMLMRYYGLFKETHEHHGEIIQRVVINMVPNGREKPKATIPDAEFKEVSNEREHSQTPGTEESNSTETT